MFLTDVMLYLMKGTLTNIRGVLKGDGKSLSEVGIDAVPTANSKNLLESGGAKNAIDIVGARVPYCVPINSTNKVTIKLSSYGCCVRAFATTGASQSIDILYANGYLTKNIVGTFFDASLSSDYKTITITETPGSGTGATYLAVNFYPSNANQTCVVASAPI